MPLSLGFILAILVSFQLAFLATFLLTHKKGKRLSNRLLGALFLFIALNMGDLAMQLLDPALVPVGLGLLNDAFLFLFGPLMFLYTLSNIYSTFRLETRYLLHGIPCLLMLLIYGLSFSLDQASIPEQTANSLAVQVFSGGLYCHLFLYYFLSRRALNHYRLTLRESYSDLEERNLEWLAFAIDNFGVMAVLSLLLNLSPFFGSKLAMGIGLFAILLFLFYFTNRVIFKALRQPELFSGIPEPTPIKYAASKLSPSEGEQLRTRLLQVMERERFFLNPDLTLDQLAAKLDCPPKKLSQVINQSMGKSFYDFVNHYRIEEAKRLLRNPPDPKMTIQEVMYDVGFSSKSSFNTVFKKMTGMTPSGFRRG